ncbi:MAG TPA: shikimate dehydrogenase, partial [Phenylobacterium sp.]
AAAFIDAGAADVRIVNRTYERAVRIARGLGDVSRAFPLERAGDALDGAIAVVNATSAGLAGDGALDVPLDVTPPEAVVMDMVYQPLKTPFLAEAERLGRRTVDGLQMLIGQAAPSFEAFFGREPPPVDVRALCLETLAR